MGTKDRLEERTHGEALLDLDYKALMCSRHERFFGRVHKSITLLSLVAGSAAFATLFKPNAAVVAIAGFTIAALTFADQVWKYSDLERRYRTMLDQFMSLRSRASALTLAQLDSEMDSIDKDSIPMIEALAAPTFNANLRRHGYSDEKWFLPLNAWQRFWDAMA